MWLFLTNEELNWPFLTFKHFLVLDFILFLQFSSEKEKHSSWFTALSPQKML